MKKIDFLKIVTANATKTVADSITTDFMISGGPLAVGNIASGVLNTYTEIKEQAKQAQDALYYFQIKTFLETADLDSDEVNNFLNKNPNNMRLGLEVFKILESTVQEKQAIYIAKAFRLYVRDKINELKLNEYFHVIKQLDNHIIFEIEYDLEHYNLHKNNGIWGLPTNDNQGSIIQFHSLGAPKSYVFQKIGFVQVKPKDTPVTFSGSITPESTYERTLLYLDFYIDLMSNN